MHTSQKQSHFLTILMSAPARAFHEPRNIWLFDPTFNFQFTRKKLMSSIWLTMLINFNRVIETEHLCWANSQWMLTGSGLLPSTKTTLKSLYRNNNMVGFRAKIRKLEKNLESVTRYLRVCHLLVNFPFAIRDTEIAIITRNWMYKIPDNQATEKLPNELNLNSLYSEAGRKILKFTQLKASY